MTNPSDQPHRQAPGPYGPPPQNTGPVPGPRYQGPGTGPQQQVGTPPQGQPQQREWVPPERTDKGLLGALFDANFNYLVTPKLIKLFYILSLMLISLSALMVVAIGIWVAQLRDGWLLGLLIIFAAPFIWVFELLMVRIFMEAVVVRFKAAEHLRVIKDKI
ncbi:DUF4282 domain-containing protein [Actinomadura sp. 9N407]|uniref:DUF4282 domain-containing protein n=1 Tax=Actinomadura sp. 9N407 TaxID=3375154 RepID=UPI0037A77F55